MRPFAFASGGALPLAVAQQRSLKGMIHIADFYCTFLALAGGAGCTDKGGQSPLDSKDVSDYLTGKSPKSPRTISKCRCVLFATYMAPI